MSVWLYLSWFAPAWGHEVRPGYLEITETSPSSYEIVWKKPAVGEGALAIDPSFPAACTFERRLAEIAGDAAFVRGTLTCPDGLAGQTIAIVGLERTLTDVLVRIGHAAGAEETHLVQPARPSMVVGRPAAWGARVAAWLLTGVEHIAFGFDHLLFVLGLLLIVPSTRALVGTITAFTAAHSITLALATLHVVHLPTRPVEAAIALSILFLGPEIARTWHGETSFTLRRPWVVAFAFGLLHGFGFATGLSAAGLPSDEIPLALACFNVGVEVGQLAVVLVALAIRAAARSSNVAWPVWLRHAPGYVVGSLGAYWLLDRTAVIAVR